MATVLRHDRTAFERGDRAVDAAGFLRVPVTMTRTGVFPYRRADGSIVRELRHPDDVLAPDHLASLPQLTITVNHPAGRLVTADTFKTDSVGTTSTRVDVVDVDNGERGIESDAFVGDAKAVDAILSGKAVEASLGYTVELVDQSGEYNGQRYDARQTNMVANHLAIVVSGRAGSNVRFRLDDGDGIQTDDADTGEGEETMIKIDGIEYTDEQAAKVNALRADIDTANAKADAHKARADKADGRVAELETEIASVKTDAADRLPRADAMAAARKRIELEGHAAAHKVEVKADASDNDIVKALVAKLAPQLDTADRTDSDRAAMLDVLLDGAKAAEEKTAAGRSLNTDAGDPIANAAAEVASRLG